MGDRNDPSVVDALKTIQLQDFKDVGRIPCARSSLLYGIGSAAGLGAIRFLAKRNARTAANWAVAAFCGVAAISFEMCNLDRKQKLQKLQLIVKATDSRQRRLDEAKVVTERIKNGAFQVVVETPAETSSKDN